MNLERYNSNRHGSPMPQNQAYNRHENLDMRDASHGSPLAHLCHNIKPNRYEMFLMAL